ncbi:GUN4 domain-containing protein [Scytonema sp. UIC 10036]|uniref:GUN4 domain-containing protein n=1 Tax=Scytonema sp. UIC 10036 TaxID=2304196 RepID=UPI001FAAF149|nr:GUN4 domain-containing protein [Scytonema sp. UIC 10036]
MPTSQQRKQLQDALMSAFPERSLLEQLLDYELDKTLNQITQDSNLKTVVYQLIQRAQAEGWLVELVRAACKENPGNSQLEAIATELLPPETHDVPPPIILTQPNTQQQKILILAANPKNTSRMRLDEELREIEQGLQRARQREQFQIKSALAVRPRDIHRSILDFNPNIVHFSGHGAGQDGLIFEDETGQVKLVDALALARLFKLFANRVKCVVLNACYSEIQAKAIARHIDYVIGMSQAVGDRAAIEFAVGFYDALGAGRSIEFAHELGCTLIQIQGIGEELTPNLLDKKQIVDSPSANQQNFNPQTNVVIETRSTVVTARSDDDLNTESLVSPSDNFSSNQNRVAPAETPESRRQQHTSGDDLPSDRGGDLLFEKAEQLESAPPHDLSSDRDVNYTKLRDLLKAGQWKEADEETLAVMLKVAGRETEGWLDVESIENFPCTDLRTIDQLWVKYSNGRFGFSVQKRIWESVGKDYEKFGDAIGWRREIEEEIEKGWWMNKKKERVKRKTWIRMDEVTYNTKAPLGHLPRKTSPWGGWSSGFLGLFFRVETCKL